MNPNTAIEGLDAEILAVRSELAAHIDGTLIPLMVRRALARMALGQGEASPDASAPAADPGDVRHRPMAGYVPSGASARILQLLVSAHGGTMAPRQIREALPELMPNTVAKALVRLHKDGFVSREDGRYASVPQDPAVAVRAKPRARKKKAKTSNLSVVLRILRSGPAVGMPTAEVYAAAAESGLGTRQARATCYNLMARKLVVHDTDRGAWRLA